MMRLVLLAGMAVLTLGACASSGGADGPRPPQGIGPGGTDFGYWRRDQDGAVDAAFRRFVTGKYDGSDRAQAEIDLTTDGFKCEDGNRPEGRPVALLECIRVYQLHDDVHAWSIEFLTEEGEPRARYTRTRIMDRFGGDDDA